MINQDLFCNYFCFLIVCIFILIFINFFLEKKKREFKDYFIEIIKNKSIRNITIKYSIIFASSLIYFLFIAKIAVYNTNRYIVPIYCITFISFFSLMILLFSNIENQNKVYFYALIILFLTIIFGKKWKNFWKWIFKTSLSDPLENYSNLNCIFIYDKR